VTRNDKRTIEVYPQVRDGKEALALIDPTIGIVLHPLLERAMVHVQAIALLPLKPSGIQAKAGSKVCWGSFLNIFGRREHAEAVGKFLSDNSIYLQHPKCPEAGYPYMNPHLVTRRYDNIITENNLAGGIPDSIHRQTLGGRAVSSPQSMECGYF
jgi:hypothetical protein